MMFFYVSRLTSAEIRFSCSVLARRGSTCSARGSASSDNSELHGIRPFGNQTIFAVKAQKKFRAMIVAKQKTPLV